MMDKSINIPLRTESITPFYVMDILEKAKALEDFDKLVELAEVQQQPVIDSAAVEEEIDEKFKYEPIPVNLPSGWSFVDWRQKHMMALADSECFTKDYPHWLRRNYEVAKAAIESGCFELPTMVEPAILDDMNIWDVEQLWAAVSAEWMNRINTPKNS